MAASKIDVSKNAVIYARFSSHNQNEQSIEGQVSAAYKYAESHGYNIIHEYVDRAKTGKTDKREQFQEMLKDAKKKRFSIIILWKTDRFGRSREEIVLNKRYCRNYGVHIECVAEFIPEGPESVIVEGAIESFAEYYSLQLSQNVKRGMDESAKKCQSTGGNIPSGYMVDENKKFVLDPQMAPVVKMIFELYASGKTSTEIIKLLNAKGIKNKRGNPFTKHSLQAMLKNEKYLGIYKYKDIRIEGGMPRIIDDDTFYQVQHRLKVNIRTPKSKWNYSDYILTDKLFCGKCGEAMRGESGTGKTGQKHTYYTCINRRVHKTCSKKPIRQNVIENIVINKTIELLNDNDLIEFLIQKTWEFYEAQDDYKTELTVLENELKQTEKAINNLIKAVEAGMFNDSMKARLDELEKQKYSISLSIKELLAIQKMQLSRNSIEDYFYGLRDKAYTDRGAQKQLIKTFVNAIFLYDDYVKITYNYSKDSHTITLSDFVKASDNGASECSYSAPYAPPKQSQSNTPQTYLWFECVFAINVEIPQA